MLVNLVIADKRRSHSSTRRLSPRRRRQQSRPNRRTEGQPHPSLTPSPHQRQGIAKTRAALPLRRMGTATAIRPMRLKILHIHPPRLLLPPALLVQVQELAGGNGHPYYVVRQESSLLQTHLHRRLLRNSPPQTPNPHNTGKTGPRLGSRPPSSSPPWPNGAVWTKS